MDSKLPMKPILTCDENYDMEEEIQNDKLQYRSIKRLTCFAIILTCLAILFYELLLVPKGYFKNDNQWNSEVSSKNPCIMENGRDLRLRLIKDFRYVKNCFT